MPTGYTYLIEKDCTFKEYTLSCARAFGALIHMRDEPADAPITIPDEDALGGKYHLEELAKAKKLLSEWSDMLPAIRIEKYKSYKEEKITYYMDQITANDLIEIKYDKMKKEVHAWVPPSEDHEGLKTFMLEQIETGRPKMSSYYQEELDKIYKLKYRTWEVDYLARLNRDIEYHSKDLKENKERNSNRAKWITELQSSLRDKDLVNEITN